MVGRPVGSKDKKPRNKTNYFGNKNSNGAGLPSNVKKIERTEKKDEISRIVGESVQYFNREPARTTEEVADRLNAYFAQCCEMGQIPTVEDMALSLGVTRRTLDYWETNTYGKNPERADLIHQAKEVLAAIDAKLVSEGKIPQVTYIFRAKNYFGMSDQRDVVITPNTNPLGDTVNMERLQQKYLENSYGMNDDITIELPENTDN